MTKGWQRHLEAASGYLDLGMVDAAADEIEEIDPPNKTRLEVIAFRIEIYRVAQKWDAMESVALCLARSQPEEPKWILDLAFAARRARGVPDAGEILEHAEEQFPACALLHYNLACYACVMGDHEEAKRRLKIAFDLDKTLRAPALNDPDLDAIFGAEKSDG